VITCSARSQALGSPTWEPPSCAAKSTMRRSPAWRASRMPSRVGSARVRTSLAA